MNEETRFYTWRKCSTCRNAKKALDKLGIEVVERDFFEDRLNRDELSALVDVIGIDDLFSWRSPSAKPQRARKDSITEAELIDAMLEEPRLIRRPIVLSEDGSPIIGFNADAYATING